MAASVRIPTVLRGLTDGSAEVRVPGETVRDLLAGLEEGHPGFAERILDEHGELRRFVNVFVGEDDVRFLDGLATPVSEGTVVSIIPAVAGGA